MELLSIFYLCWPLIPLWFVLSFRSMVGMVGMRSDGYVPAGMTPGTAGNPMAPPKFSKSVISLKSNEFFYNTEFCKFC